ncbi:MAG TPA: hypothetical protein VI583_11965 [Cyclobacteriaceae bacterium]|nr:hypothetical protein [Cyclobacteriaceae bacterium]
MNPRLETFRNQLNEVRPELMKKQNVVATGIGYKLVGGKPTKDLSIVCSVEIKKTKERLSANDLVPPLIGSLPTDVKPVGLLRAFQDPRERYRPAPGSVSIGHYQITAGTLGCLVKKDGITYILSNNHVLANSNEASPGDPILQPGPYDGGSLTNDQIAVLSEFIPITFEEDDKDSCKIASLSASILNQLARLIGSRSRLRVYRVQQAENHIDCAIAKPLNPEDVINEILGYGKISGVRAGELEMGIKKSGRTTGLTSGTIEQVDVSARVSYGANKTALFTDQLLAGAMSQGGDSGSAVLTDDNYLVGLLFAGSETTTIINRIENVFSALQISLP